MRQENKWFKSNEGERLTVTPLSEPVVSVMTENKFLIRV